MNIGQNIHSLLVICQVAKRRGISTAQCRAEIAAAIEQAWATTDPLEKQRQIELVGDSHKPTPEEFLSLVSKKLHENT